MALVPKPDALNIFGAKHLVRYEVYKHGMYRLSKAYSLQYSGSRTGSLKRHFAGVDRMHK